MNEPLFFRPEIKEVVLKSDKHGFFEPLERSHKIILSEGLIELFQYIPIISFVLPNRDLLPMTSRTFRLVNHGWQWHRDPAFPIIGVYKPLGNIRNAGTLFTCTDMLPKTKDKVIPDKMVGDQYIVRSDYGSKQYSKLILFNNRQLKDGTFLFHKKETINETIYSVVEDLGKNYSIHVENISKTEILDSD